MNPYHPLSDRTKTLLGVAGITAVLVAWAAICFFGMVPPYKLPAPWAVVDAFWTMATNGTLLTATMWSAGRVLAATGLTVLVGVPLGACMGAFPKVNAVLSPILDPLKSSPTPAFLPLLIMALGLGEPTKLCFLFISTVVYLAPMVRDALVAVPSQHWVVATDLGATPVENAGLVLFPLALPRIWDAIGVAVSICWTYVPLAEFVASDGSSGLGNLIQNSQRFSNTAGVLAGIFAIVAVALLTQKALELTKKRLFPWEGL